MYVCTCNRHGVSLPKYRRKCMISRENNPYSQDILVLINIARNKRKMVRTMRARKIGKGNEISNTIT